MRSLSFFLQDRDRPLTVAATSDEVRRMLDQWNHGGYAKIGLTLSDGTIVRVKAASIQAIVDEDISKVAERAKALHDLQQELMG